VIDQETQIKIVKNYLGQWATYVSKEEADRLLSIIEQGRDYYVRGSRDNINKFVTIFLLRKGRLRWRYRTTYDTVAFYLSDDEDTPDFCDITTQVLIVENCKNLPENKLMDNLNLHLLTQRQSNQKTTIIIPTVPFPCLEPLCKAVNLGTKKITNKVIKAGDIL
jgi:hypothetical protein